MLQAPKTKMGRKCKPKVFKSCLICGDSASGINFNALTCASCKAFFRRNAVRNKEFKCPFSETCIMDLTTRKFCTKCRLKKCFDVGMKKEWILTEEEKLLYKNKILLNRISQADDQKEEGSSDQQFEQHQQSQFELQPQLTESSSSTPFTYASPNSSYTPSSASSASYSQYTPAYSEHKVELFIESSSSPSSSNWNSATSSSSSCISQTNSASFNQSSSLEINEPLESNLDELCNQLFPNGDFNSMSNFALNDSDILDILSLSESLSDPQFPETNQALSIHDSNQSDFINHCTQSTPDFPNNNNQITESHYTPLYREPGFPSRELISPEKFWIQELSSASSVLHNPYKQIRDYQRDYAPICSNYLSQYFFYRMIRMCKKLKSFEELMPIDQGRMLKHSLLELLAIRSVLMYHQDRDAWCFVDDKNKVGVMTKMDVIKPFCTYDYRRHQNLPLLFRDEWKRDTIIFDLLTAIILFTPRPNMIEYDKVSEEQLRYKRLLHRYLQMKYGNADEAEEAFNRLMGNIEELRILNVDVFNFFKNYSNYLAGRPLFTELLDLKRHSISVNSFNNFTVQ